MWKCSLPCSCLLLRYLDYYMVHGCGDDGGKTRGSGTTLSKQNTQGNLQEGATVTVTCRSVHEGLSPILRAHGAQHSSPAEGDKRVRFPGRPSQHSRQLQNIGDHHLDFPEEENPREVERWMDRGDESQGKWVC